MHLLLRVPAGELGPTVDDPGQPRSALAGDFGILGQMEVDVTPKHLDDLTDRGVGRADLVPVEGVEDQLYELAPALIGHRVTGRVSLNQHPARFMRENQARPPVSPLLSRVRCDGGSLGPFHETSHLSLRVRLLGAATIS